ncbi:hypothetical protein [Brevibacillus sp. SIMBA_040]|uniref:hypothetical protein n=1 Tax=unclassified Brevibacillus TaxID=2684853 RepID=UPI00397A2465
MKQLLEKWECLNDSCGHSFLVDKGTAKGKSLSCPFCEQSSEAVAHQNPDADLETQLEGCLYPY